MAIPFQAYKDALLQLQAQYDALSLGSFILQIEPINGLDMFYSDGSAQNYTGKIVLYKKGKDYSYSQVYFRQSGIVYNVVTPTQTLFQKWIEDVAINYASKQEKH